MESTKGRCSEVHEYEKSTIWKAMRFGLLEVFVENKAEVVSRVDNAEWEVAFSHVASGV